MRNRRFAMLSGSLALLLVLTSASVFVFSNRAEYARYHFDKTRSDPDAVVAGEENEERNLAATFGNRLLLWNLAARSVVAELSLPGPLHGLTFTPGGDRLLTANGNGTLFVYRLERP